MIQFIIIKINLEFIKVKFPKDNYFQKLELCLTHYKFFQLLYLKLNILENSNFLIENNLYILLFIFSIIIYLH